MGRTRWMTLAFIVAGIAPVACRKEAPQPSGPPSSQPAVKRSGGTVAFDPARQPSAAPNASQPSTAPAYVTCVGTFIEYEAEYSWCEQWTDGNGVVNNDHYSLPRAVYRITSPADHVGRTVAVLYRYDGKDLPAPPPLSGKGKTFSFDVPADFFAGKHGSLDNLDIANFRPAP